MKLPNLSREQKSQILAPSLAGVKNTEISAQLWISILSSVFSKDGNNTQKNEAAPKSGRKWKVSAEIQSRLIVELKTVWPQKLMFRTLRLKSLDWPSLSPDLNPLELLWQECDCRVKQLKPSNLELLEAAVRQVWTKMPADKMEKLVSWMPSLCKAVINAGAGTLSIRRPRISTRKEKQSSKRCFCFSLCFLIWSMRAWKIPNVLRSNFIGCSASERAREFSKCNKTFFQDCTPDFGQLAKFIDFSCSTRVFFS